MTTRRRTICLILSALFISSCAAFNSDSPQRIVRIKVLADVPFRTRDPRWIEEARGLIESASDYYEREFNIRLVTQSVTPWPENERIPSTPELLAKAKKEFVAATTNDDYDLVVSFTAERGTRLLTTGRPRVDRIGDCKQGLARYVIVPITKVFRYQGANAELQDDVIALIHEIGHVFGAEHVEDTNSIMNEEFGYRTEFDAKNRAIIQKNRFCPFAK
jgi:hypothetical protein